MGYLRGLRSAMAVPVFRIAAVESPANLRVPRYGGRVVRNHLLRSRARSRAGLAAGCGGITRKDSRANRIGAIDLVRRVAQINNRFVSDQRCDLVDSVRALFVRRVAVSEARALARAT